MDVDKTIMRGLTEITGLDAAELADIKDEDLFEMGVMDSLSLIGLFAFLEDETGRKYDLTGCRTEDFASIRALVRTVSSL